MGNNLKANFIFPKQRKLQFTASMKPNMDAFATKEDLREATEVFVFTQAIADNTWNIEHNLNTQISSVTVVDSANNIMIPDVIEINDMNTVTIRFLSGFTGRSSCLGNNKI